MDGHPTCAAGRIEQRVEQEPVSYGITAVFHVFGFTVRRSHRATIEMVTAYHNRGLDLALLYKLDDCQAKLRTLAIPQPANSRRQTLEFNTLARQLNPAIQNAVLGKEFQDQIVSHRNIGRVPGKRHPAERPPAFAEQRADIGRYKPRKIVGVLDSVLKSKGPDIVSVVKGHAAHLLQAQHAFHVA